MFLFRLIFTSDQADAAANVVALLAELGFQVLSRHEPPGFLVVRGRLPRPQLAGARERVTGHVAWVDVYADEVVEALRVVFGELCERRRSALASRRTGGRTDTLALGATAEIVAHSTRWGAVESLAEAAVETLEAAGWIALDDRGAGLKTARFTDAGRIATESYERGRHVWIEVVGRRLDLGRDADDDDLPHTTTPHEVPRVYTLGLRGLEVYVDGTPRGRFPSRATNVVPMLREILARHPRRLNTTDMARAIGRTEAVVRASRSQLATRLRDLVGFDLLATGDGVYALAPRVVPEKPPENAT